MRIALLTHQWPGARMGGIGTCVKESAHALAEAGHDVHVFTPRLPSELSAAPARLKLHGVSDIAEAVSRGDVPAPLAATINRGGEGIYRLALAWRLTDALLAEHAKQPFDIVEAPEVEALGLPLLLLPDFDVPVAAQLHCCTALARQANGVKLDDEGALISALEHAAIHLSDGVSAPSENLVRLTATVTSIPKKVRVIPHAFRGGGEPFALPAEAGPIVFVGRLERLKGVEGIVEALNLFLPIHPKAEFRFIGPDTNTGPDGKSMQQAMQARLRPEIAHCVHFIGQISPSQIAAEWGRASFGVMPSLCESFSMACCEAMAMGRTVIVGENTGTVELIGPAGVVVDPHSARSLCDAMNTLWTDRKRLDDLSRAAHQRVTQHLHPDRIAGLRVEFYRDVIRGFRGAADRSARLSSLPPASVAAVLPALSRLVAGMSGSDSHPIQTPGTRLLRIMDDLRSQHGAPAEVLLYGAGKHTARLLGERHLWESRRHRVVGIIDDHPRFRHEPVYLDLPVESLVAAHARLKAGQGIPPIVLSTDTYQDQFWLQAAPLREAGVAVYRLYS